MKIALVGNQNNNFFSLLRFLHDRGFEGDLLLFEHEEPQFSPYNDTFLKTLPSYIKQLNWGNPEKFLKWDKKSIEADLAPYDFIIGCGIMPAVMHWLGRKLDIFIPYGYDVFHLPFPRLVHPKRQIPFLYTAYHQLHGVRETRVLIQERLNDEYEKKMSRLKYKGNRIETASPSLYIPQYTPENIVKELKGEDLQVTLEKLREETDLIFSHPVRHEWLPEHNLKSNDKLIRGFKRFVTEHPEYTSKLILFKYGRDTEASVKLVEELGITDKVLWVPTLPRKYVMMILHYSDMVVGELFRSWLTYGGACEAMAMSKPLMHCRHDEDFKDVMPELYPMVNAHTDDMIYEGMVRLAKDPDRLRKMGQEANAWFLKYCINRPLDIIIQNITAGSQVLSHQFENSRGV